MRYKVSCSKLGNHFFFAANLSEWHFSCRQTYNKKWQELLGPLTNSEKKSLVKFCKILKDFGFKEIQPGILNSLGSAFIIGQNKNDVYKELLTDISKNDVDIVKNSLDLMEYKFNIWWKKIENTLLKNKQILEQELISDRTKKIIGIIENFFNIESTANAIDVYLLGQPDSNYMGGGGANIGKNRLTLEVNQLIPNHSSTEHALGVIFHETGHLIFMQPSIFNLIKECLNERRIDLRRKFFPEQVDPLTIVNEAILESLIPNGYLGIEYLHYQKNVLDNLNAIKNYNNFRKIIIHKMTPLAKKYIESKTSVDKEYIFKIIDELTEIKEADNIH